MNVVTLGVHVLDVHVRAVESIPDSSDGALVEEIKMSAAGTAGGTATILTKLGAEVRSLGAVGTDPLGDTLLGLLGVAGVDTTGLVRRDSAQTSGSVIPVRPNGDRPAWHCIGANGVFTVDDVDFDTVADATHLHLGGPEFLGGEAAARILAHARDHGVVTSVDMLAPGDPEMLTWIEAALPYVDHFLPNDEQLLGLTGAATLEEAGRALLDRGAGCVAVTRGAEGALVIDKDGSVGVPAFAVDVVDTTGCGDAFSAGYLRGLAAGRAPGEAAVLGCAAAALVAQGLGTDHGDFDLAAVERFVLDTPRRHAPVESSG
ncbi:MAG: PfkB family carbohydrate kinase [Nocardioides sp.]|nr:PfkB family carbohydrate kinase [Nocardioides sp.]